jgi:O-antigen/teichoic acid export membrane protein
LKIWDLFHKFDVDRAVFFGLLRRGWNFCSEPVTVILIATKFTPELQGYYYTFATILALQVFVELGLGTVIIQFASHEWSKLNLDESGHIVGDRDSLSRLSSIGDFTRKWYLIAGILAAIGLGIGGYIFFSTSHNSISNWISPWFLLCLITGINICLVPVWSLLEGCNQIAQLYTFRFFQGLLTSISIWIAILIGADLWTASIAGITTLLGSFFFLRHRYWIFIKTLVLSKPDGPKIKWRADMFPMQWRIAVSWIGGYFIFSLFVPVLFKYHGPLVAGQMGMTWNIVGMIGAISYSWLSPRAPQFGILIAQKRYAELDKQLWKVTKIVVGVSAFMAFNIWLFVFLINALDYNIATRFASRILPPLPTGLLVLAQFLFLVASPFSIYLRAHKKEPLMLSSLIYAVLVGCSTFFLGKYYSVIGMASGYLILNIIFMPIVFIIWYICRKKWHKS